MKFAIIQTSGTQYRVQEGETITLDHVDANENETITFSEVLLMVDGASVQVGTPYIAGMMVSGTVLSHKKGDKIRVATFKAKSRFHKVRGHRSHLTDVKIMKIGSEETGKANKKEA